MRSDSVDLPLELGLQDLHVKVVLMDLLLAGTLRLGLVTLLVHEHANFVRSSHALDRLRLEVLVGVARRTRRRLVVVTSAVDLTIDSRVRVDGAGLVVLGEHHEPLVLLFAVLGKKSASFILGDAGVLDHAKVLAAISFDDDHVALRDDETSVVEKIEDANARALEGNDVEHLARTAGGERRAGGTVGAQGAFVGLESDVRDLVALRQGEGLAHICSVSGVVGVVSVDTVHGRVVVVDV